MTQKPSQFPLNVGEETTERDGDLQWYKGVLMLHVKAGEVNEDTHEELVPSPLSQT